MSITHNYGGKNWKELREAEFAMRLEQEARQRPKTPDADPQLTKRRRRIEDHLAKNSDDLADLGWQ